MINVSKVQWQGEFNATKEDTRVTEKTPHFDNTYIQIQKTQANMERLQVTHER